MARDEHVDNEKANNPKETVLGRRGNVYRTPHLRTTIDFSQPDMLLGLGVLIPVLDCDTVRLGLDAGLPGGEITIYFDGIHSAALVRINPVVTFEGNEAQVVTLPNEQNSRTKKWNNHL